MQISVFEITEHVFQIEMSIFKIDICISHKMFKTLCILDRDIGLMLKKSKDCDINVYVLRRKCQVPRRNIHRKLRSRSIKIRHARRRTLDGQTNVVLESASSSALDFFAYNLFILRTIYLFIYFAL